MIIVRKVEDRGRRIGAACLLMVRPGADAVLTVAGAPPCGSLATATPPCGSLRGVETPIVFLIPELRLIARVANGLGYRRRRVL